MVTKLTPNPHHSWYRHVNRIPVAGGKSFLLRKRVSGTPSTPGKSSEPETSASPLDNDPKQK